MARPIKAGLQYFPLDVDFFSDDKIELISSEYGLKGEVIAIRLLCMVYRNGYYYQWGEDESLLFAKRVGNGITGSLVNEVVSGLVKRSFFDKRVFDSFQILTSRGIQKRYLEAKERSKEVTLIEEITLIDVNTALKGVNVTLTDINGYKSTQNKVKESKVKESKREDRPPPANLSESNLFRQPKVPSWDEVHRTFLQQGGTEEMAKKFFEVNQSVGWFYKGSPVVNFATQIPGYIKNWLSNNKISSNKSQKNEPLLNGRKLLNPNL